MDEEDGVHGLWLVATALMLRDGDGELAATYTAASRLHRAAQARLVRRECRGPLARLREARPKPKMAEDKPKTEDRPKVEDRPTSKDVPPPAEDAAEAGGSGASRRIRGAVRTTREAMEALMGLESFHEGVEVLLEGMRPVSAPAGAPRRCRGRVTCSAR